MKNFFLISTLVMSLAFAAAAQKTKWNIVAEGAMREMFATGTVDGKIDISALADKKHLWGVGPLDGLSGEIMIWDGRVLTSSIGPNGIVTKDDENARAVFFVSANAGKWKEVAVPKDIATYDDLERFIATAAENVNLDSTEAFPFLLKGRFARVEWHINDYKPDGTKLTHEKHDAMKFKRVAERAKLEMIGFFSPKHKGVFTHHTRTTHIHATDRKRSFIGHVDDLKLNGGYRLFLPVR